MSTLPSSALDTPYPHESIPGELSDILELGTWLSPSRYLDAGIKFVFGTNPAEMVADWVTGDWEGLSRASSALGQLGEYCEAYGSQVAVMNDLMMFHWTGHAADRADAYFGSLADTVNDFAPSLYALRDRYQDIATSMVTFAELVKAGIDFIENKLIAIGAKAIADALLSETVIGSLVVSAWMISDAHESIHKLHELVEAYDVLTLKLKGLVAAGSLAVGAIGGIPELALPPAYHAPGAIS